MGKILKTRILTSTFGIPDDGRLVDACGHKSVAFVVPLQSEDRAFVGSQSAAETA